MMVGRLVAAAGMLAVLTLTACERHEGPAERLGSKIDNTLNPGPSQNAGRSVDKALGN